MQVEARPARLRNGVGQPLREINVGRDLFDPRFDDERHGEGQRELRIPGRRIGWKQIEQPANPGPATVEDEANAVVGEQARSPRPISRGLGMADGLHDIPVLFVPGGGFAVQGLDAGGIGASQLEAQEVGEKVVVAKPGAGDIERGDEGVRLLEVLQDPLTGRGAGEEVRQWPAHTVKDRGPEQQFANLRRTAVQHLGHQVAGDGSLASRELADEPLGIGVLGEREGSQPQPGHPALGPLMQLCQRSIRDLDAARLEQLPRLLAGEPQLGVSDLRQPTGEA